MNMEKRLSDRKEAILRIVVEEYVRSGGPVASLDIVTVHGLGVSSATVRNEIAWLKEEGYLSQPHTSAGSVPADLGYRYYVNRLLPQEDISVEEQRLVRHMFYQVEREMEEWMALSAVLLAKMARNVALVVPPKSTKARLDRLHLVAVNSCTALLVLLLRNGRQKRTLVDFGREISKSDLDIMSTRMNALLVGLNGAQLSARSRVLPAGEARVAAEAARIMSVEDQREYEEPRLEGLRHLLGQPEFSHGEKMLGIMEQMEKKSLVRSVLAQGKGANVSVVIGTENPEVGLQDLSIVSACYGVPQEFIGTLGVIGPRRMQYSRSISAVRFLSSLLSMLAAELYGDQDYENRQ